MWKETQSKQTTNEGMTEAARLIATFKKAFQNYS